MTTDTRKTPKQAAMKYLSLSMPLRCDYDLTQEGFDCWSSHMSEWQSAHDLVESLPDDAKGEKP